MLTRPLEGCPCTRRLPPDIQLQQIVSVETEKKRETLSRESTKISHFQAQKAGKTVTQQHISEFT